MPGAASSGPRVVVVAGNEIPRVIAISVARKDAKWMMNLAEATGGVYLDAARQPARRVRARWVHVPVSDRGRDKRRPDSAERTREPLSDKRARVAVVGEPPACAMTGLATGVGGLKDGYESTGDGGVAHYRADAVIALRNALGDRGGTHVAIDATVLYGRIDRWANVLLCGRAYRC